MSVTTRPVDWALVNTETQEVLRTSSNDLMLRGIAAIMAKAKADLGGDGTVYVVQEMRRSTMGDSLYTQAIDVRWREAQRRQNHVRIERELGAVRMSKQPLAWY